MIGPTSRFLVLSANGGEVLARGAFVAQLDRSHFLIDTHADGLYSQRVVSPAEMKQMHIFPNETTYNEFVSKRFPAPPAPPREEEFELTDEPLDTSYVDRGLPEAVVSEVGIEAACADDSDAEDEVSMCIASENCG
jgi:hypothetical protein